MALFGNGEEQHSEVMSELQSLRFRVEEVLGRTDDPPETKAEFYNRVDAESDTAKHKIDCVIVSRVLSVAFKALKKMPPRQRAAMLQELLR